MSYPKTPPPKSLLDRRRILSPNATIRVSPICLGTMNFGDAWTSFMGYCPKSTVFEILDYYFQSGGNFIDTASNYQNEESETWLGKWMAARGNRDQLVLATKYTTNFQDYKGDEGRINSNFVGNHLKCMRLSLEASLKKLQTDYVDIFYVHWWDNLTTPKELVLGLNRLVNAGKVLYLGASDLPAFYVAKCNQYARDNNLQGFSVYQGLYNCARRDLERDIMPLCQEDGMALAAFGTLGRGDFRATGDERRPGQSRKVTGLVPQPNAHKVVPVLQRIADSKKGGGATITGVALAYALHKTTYIFPVCGGRTVDHLRANIEALALELSDDDMAGIDAAADFDLGFPFGIVGPTARENLGLMTAGVTDYVESERPIPARKMVCEMR